MEAVAGAEAGAERKPDDGEAPAGRRRREGRGGGPCGVTGKRFRPAPRTLWEVRAQPAGFLRARSALRSDCAALRRAGGRAGGGGGETGGERASGRAVPSIL